MNISNPSSSISLSQAELNLPLINNEGVNPTLNPPPPQNLGSVPNKLLNGEDVARRVIQSRLEAILIAGAPAVTQCFNLTTAVLAYLAAEQLKDDEGDKAYPIHMVAWLNLVKAIFDTGTALTHVGLTILGPDGKRVPIPDSFLGSLLYGGLRTCTSASQATAKAAGRFLDSLVQGAGNVVGSYVAKRYPVADENKVLKQYQEGKLITDGGNHVVGGAGKFTASYLEGKHVSKEKQLNQEQWQELQNMKVAYQTLLTKNGELTQQLNEKDDKIAQLLAQIAQR